MAPIPTTSPEVAVGLPANLLRQRPDIRRAERNVASRSAQIGVAEADLYPRFVLFGFLGYFSNDFASLFAEKSFTGFVAPTFQWNILNYGRLLNNIRLQQSRFNESVLTYRQTVLQAYRETEDVLVAFLEARNRPAGCNRALTRRSGRSNWSSINTERGPWTSTVSTRRRPRW